MDLSPMHGFQSQFVSFPADLRPATVPWRGSGIWFWLMPCLIAGKWIPVWQQYKKIVKENWIPVNFKKVTLGKESVFLLLNRGKHFPSGLSFRSFSHTAVYQLSTGIFSSKSQRKLGTRGNWAGIREQE